MREKAQMRVYGDLGRKEGIDSNTVCPSLAKMHRDGLVDSRVPLA